MAAYNDVTGDKIKSKSLSAQGAANYDNIDWGRREREAQAIEQKGEDAETALQGTGLTVSDFKVMAAALDAADAHPAVQEDEGHES